MDQKCNQNLSETLITFFKFIQGSATHLANTCFKNLTKKYLSFTYFSDVYSFRLELIYTINLVSKFEEVLPAFVDWVNHKRVNDKHDIALPSFLLNLRYISGEFCILNKLRCFCQCVLIRYSTKCCNKISELWNIF